MDHISDHLQSQPTKPQNTKNGSSSASSKESPKSGPLERASSPPPLEELCPECFFPIGQPGFTGHEAPVGHALFGKVIPCPTCHAEEMSNRAVKCMTALEGKLSTNTFDNFSIRAENKEAYEAALKFSQEPKALLTLWGPYGPGKTHLLCAIFNALRVKGIDVEFVTMPDLVSMHRDTIGNPGQSAEDFYQRISTTRVLLIDEIDKASLKDWTREQAFRLFNRRDNLTTSTGTAMAMNKSPENYKDDLGYLFSRMQGEENQVVYLEGDNRKQASFLKRLKAQI